MIETTERNFLTGLLILSAGLLGWLFSPFLAALFFALILVSSTNFGYLYLLNKGLKPIAASAVMVLGIAITIIVPFGYLMIEGVLQITELYNYLNTNNRVSNINIEQFYIWVKDYGVSDEYVNHIKQFIDGNIGSLIKSIKDILLSITSNVFSNTMGFFTFMGLTLFCLFFFYIDGHKVIDNLKAISPLHDDLDQKLFEKFAYLASVLTITVFSIALLQGLSFGLIMGVLGMPILLTFTLIAVASFIPIVGGTLVWVPIAIYFGAGGEWIKMAITIVWGAVINGLIIDNIVRPIIVIKISSLLTDQNNISSTSNPLSHTLIIVLSTFAGIIQFGILGLFSGPIIAALGITVFEMYRDYVNPVVKVHDDSEQEDKDVEEVKSNG